MNPTEQAARWLADVPRRMIEDGGDYLYHGKRTTYLPEAIALAAIARHLAPGDDLVKRAEAALEGVTDGPWKAAYSKWEPNNFIVQTDHPCRRVLAQFDGDGDGPDVQSLADARFIAFARQWVPEAAARIAALTTTVAELEATVAEVTSDRAYIIGANAGWEAAVEQGEATPAAAAVLTRINEAEDRIAAVANAAEADSARLRAILVTIVSRCDTAKQQCNDGEPVSAFNLASAILGQIGSYRATLQPSEKPE